MLSVKKNVSRLVMGAASTVALLISSVPQAKADIITTLVGSPVKSGNQYLWTYDAELSFNSELVPGAAMPQFGTLYDFSNQLPVVQNVTGLLALDFGFTENLTDPAAYKVLPIDNSALYNVRFTFNGPTTLVGVPYNISIGAITVTVGTNLLDLGQFTVVSPTNQMQSAFYDGQTFNSFGSAIGTAQGNLGSTNVPVPVPEPTCLGLLGLGAAGLLGRRRRI